jgi:hypothetical protein
MTRKARPDRPANRGRRGRVRRGRAGAGALLAALALTGAGCLPVAPRQVAYGDADTPLMTRDVEVQTRAAYYTAAPDCAFVLPATRAFGNVARARRVEDALAAHFALRLGHVVPADRVRAAARALAVDPAEPDHRAILARNLGCPAVLKAAPHGGGDLYAGVWSQARVGLAVQLRRAGDDALLWRARHVATRSAGGVPLSPLAAAGELVTTAGFHADPELTPSLLHDAARRLASALPALPTAAGASAPSSRAAISPPSRGPGVSARLTQSGSPTPARIPTPAHVPAPDPARGAIE